MARKAFWWTIGIAVFVVLTLSGVFIVTRIIPETPRSWGWFFGVLGVEFSVGLIIPSILSC